MHERMARGCSRSLLPKSALVLSITASVISEFNHMHPRTHLTWGILSRDLLVIDVDGIVRICELVRRLLNQMGGHSGSS